MAAQKEEIFLTASNCPSLPSSNTQRTQIIKKKNTHFTETSCEM